MNTTLAVGQGETELQLPVIPYEQRPSPSFKTPVEYPGLPGFGAIESGNSTGYAEIDQLFVDPKTNQVYGFAKNASAEKYPWGNSRFEEQLEHRTSDRDPAHSSVVGVYAVTKEIKNRQLRVEQDVRFSSDKSNFRLIFTRRFLENGALRHEKTWDETIPRDFQ